MALCGYPVEELLGIEPFAARGPLRKALMDVQGRQRWRATLEFENAPLRKVSMSQVALSGQLERVI